MFQIANRWEHSEYGRRSLSKQVNYLDANCMILLVVVRKCELVDVRSKFHARSVLKCTRTVLGLHLAICLFLVWSKLNMLGPYSECT